MICCPVMTEQGTARPVYDIAVQEMGDGCYDVVGLSLGGEAAVKNLPLYTVTQEQVDHLLTVAADHGLRVTRLPPPRT
jgi:hypothetical protein